MNKEFERKDPFVGTARGGPLGSKMGTKKKGEFQNLIDSWNGSYSKCRNVPDPGPTLPSIILSSPSPGRLSYCIQLCIIAISHLSLCSVCALFWVGGKNYPQRSHIVYSFRGQKIRPPQNVA